MYKLIYLPTAIDDILEIEERLFIFSPAASDRFAEEITNLTETLLKHPAMFQHFEDDDYYRSNYRLFYHISEAKKAVEVHRVIHGMMDLKTQLQ